MSDQSKLIFSGNTLSANIAAPAPSLLYLYRYRSIWKAVLDWDSINLCYNKGQRLGVSSTQLRSRAVIDVSLHSTSAWKEALSKQIACSQNLLCVLNCRKSLIFFGNIEWCLQTVRRDSCCRIQSCNVYGLWLVDELNESVSCAVNLWVEGRAVSHTGLYLGEEKASEDDGAAEGTVEWQLLI